MGHGKVYDSLSSRMKRNLCTSFLCWDS